MIWVPQPIHLFLVGCLNPCLQGTNVRVGSPRPVGYVVTLFSGILHGLQLTTDSKKWGVTIQLNYGFRISGTFSRGLACGGGGGGRGGEARHIYGVKDRS